MKQASKQHIFGDEITSHHKKDSWVAAAIAMM